MLRGCRINWTGTPSLFILIIGGTESQKRESTSMEQFNKFQFLTETPIRPKRPFDTIQLIIRMVKSLVIKDK